MSHITNLIRYGEMTVEEIEWRKEQGLFYENSDGELVEVDTFIDTGGSSVLGDTSDTNESSADTNASSACSKNAEGSKPSTPQSFSITEMLKEKERSSSRNVPASPLFELSQPPPSKSRVPDLSETKSSDDLFMSAISSLPEEVVSCSQKSDANEPKSIVDITADSLITNDSVVSEFSDGISTISKRSETDDDLDDTITRMDKLLALAEEQEAQEKAAEEKAKALCEQSPAELVPETPESEEKPVRKTIRSASKPKPTNVVAPQQPVLPVKRVMELSKRNLLFSPSPPRPRPNAALPRGIPVKPPFTTSRKPEFPKPEPTSALKKTSRPTSPATNIKVSKFYSPGSTAPKAHSCTPKASPKEFKPVSKMGFRGNVLESPVANYIHARASPSPFQRTMAKENAKPCASMLPRPGLISCTKIPKPSFVTPKSTAKTPKSVYETSVDAPIPPNTLSESRFNSQKSPVKIGIPKPISTSANKFKNLHYSGPNKLVSAPSENAIAGAFRHTGLRDESGNASIIQSAVVEKKFIPSRLVMPKSYKK